MQIFFLRGTEEHHHFLMNHFVYGSVVRLSLSEFGCRVIQTILSCICNKQIITGLIHHFQRQHEDETTPYSMHSTLTQCNANHVCQAIVELGLQFKHVAFVRDALERDLAVYSENIYSCRVVQGFVKMYGAELNVCLLLKTGSHLWLSGLTFGNYVIQCIIKTGEDYSNSKMFKRFRQQLLLDIFDDAEQLLVLSRDKHGSNVIEACIRAAEKSEIDMFLHTICRKRGYLLDQMIRGQFSNYVPKTLIKYCDRQQQKKLVECVHANITSVWEPDPKYSHCSEFLHECQVIKYNTARKRRYSQKKFLTRRQRILQKRIYPSYSKYMEQSLCMISK